MQKLKPKSPLQRGMHTIERLLSQLSLLPLLCLMLASLPVQQVYGQKPGGEVKREKCTVCGKLKQNCPYKGNHPKCTTCGKVKEQCPYKGNHPKCATCGKAKEQCPYNGDHPAPEAAGYDVTISCNVPEAVLYIDDNQNGTASGTRFLKTGQHTVKLTAEGYKDFTQKITVGASSKEFSFIMVKEEKIQSTVPAVIQQIERDMVLVEGGTFTMGATAKQGSDADNYEYTTHEVMLSDFRLCRHEVTQAEWEAVMGANPSYFKGANRPVEQISWDDCQTFIRKLNALTGKAYRLPTEAEWEYAARGGQKSQGYKYSGSNAIDSVAWYWVNSVSKTHNVMTKAANELGLYDMSGNVWEWCNDWYGSYSASSQTNPKGASSGSERVIRGGGWSDYDGSNPVSIRSSIMPGNRGRSLGLRLAL